jgi:hypothetical protein
MSAIAIFPQLPPKTGVLVGSAYDSTFQEVHVGHDQDLLQGHSPVINAPHHAPLVSNKYCSRLESPA